MSFSIQREVSNGTLSTINLSIVYIDRADINVYVDDLPIDLTGGATPYTWEWITDLQIKITPNVPNGIVAIIKRTTPLDKMYHDYTAGAVFKDLSMDENFTQLLHLSQEAIEGSGATDFYANLNIHGYRITNMGAAIDGGDAIPFVQYQSDALGALASRQGAEAARNAAAASQAAALASQNAAALSETNAALSEANALASANTATTQAGIATTKASEASVSAASAAASFDSFDDRYLGPKAADPSVDNDGNGLLSGALYWNNVSNTMRVWNGSIWQPTFISTSGDVVGPASAADNQLALFDGATGNLLKAGPLITTSATDTTAGRMMKVGDFGLGIPIHTTNLNTLTGTGLFECGDVTGTPSASFLGWWVYQIDAGAGFWKNQTAWQQGNPTAQYVRSSGDGTTWGAWRLAVFADSPALTGIPTAPTATPGTNTTQIASTEFVLANSVGSGQTWQNMTGSRVNGVTYTNSTGKPIQVSVGATVGSNGAISLTVSGVAISGMYIGNNLAGTNHYLTAIIPNGATYVLTGGTVASWQELR